MTMETTEEAAAYWKRAADREAREGHTATAITFRNMAWLIEHPEGWKRFCDELKKEAS